MMEYSGKCPSIVDPCETLSVLGAQGYDILCGDDRWRHARSDHYPEDRRDDHDAADDQRNNS